MDGKKVQRQQTLFAVVCLFGFAALLRLTIGMSFINTFDTFWYRNWALDLPNGLFDVYTRAEEISLDYPPLYLFALYPIGKVYESLTPEGNYYIQMLLLKFFPLLFDMLCGLFLYRIFKSEGELTAIVAAMAWLCNPSMLFNSACWGQTDSIMAFLLLISFWYLNKGRPTLAAVLFAIAGLTKYQCLMFTPVFLLQLYFNHSKQWLRIGKALLAAAATVAVVFLPFMIGSRDPLLFFKVYLTGADSYPYCSLYCFNLYGMLGLDWSTDIPDTTPFIGPITYQMFGTFLLVLSMLLLLMLYIRGKCRNAWVGGLFIMQCIFMLTTRMHERYQIIVLPFALMAWLTTRKRGFAISYLLLSLMTLFNQVMVLLFHLHSGLQAPWEQCYPTLIIVMSALNFVLFLYTVYVCMRTFLVAEEQGQMTETEVNVYADQSA